MKHFPGQGRSGADTHIRKAVVDTPIAELRTRDLVPFQRLIDSGTDVVMMNHLDYTELNGDVPASLSPAAYALLRYMFDDHVVTTDELYATGAARVDLKTMTITITGGTTVTVDVRDTYDTTFLGIIGITSMTVTGHGQARITRSVGGVEQ